ncbi:MAG: hypothetical protein CL878_12075 [Dehalococcoidia bacterium]|nr:hypothetical protein [Dehalococcoidia bacterium]
MAQLQAALIGCGGRGRGYLRELTQLTRFDDVVVVAVCDPVAAVREPAAADFAVPRQYEAIEEMLASETLDAVFVATPAHLNAQCALPCLERGVNTLLEKPPGLSVAETKGLRDAAQRTGAKGMVGWQRRFNPFIVEARQKIEARGPIAQLVGEFHKSITGLAAAGRWPEQVMDNMLLESPIHAIDVVRAMAGGEVAEVHSVVQRRVSDYKDVHAALVLFDNGCVAQLTAAYTGGGRLERYEIHGRDISAYLEGVSGGVAFYDGGRRELTGDGPAATVAQNRFFLDCVKEDRQVTLPAANLDEAIKTMELAEQILAGLRS